MDGVGSGTFTISVPWLEGSSPFRDIPQYVEDGYAVTVGPPGTPTACMAYSSSCQNSQSIEDAGVGGSACPDPTEPNDSIGPATTLPMDVTVHTQVGSDLDFYKLEGAGPSGYC